MYKKLKDLKKRYQFFYSLIIVIALIGIWRGVWRLFDYYVLPENYVLSSFATLLFGVAVIAITHYRLA